MRVAEILSCLRKKQDVVEVAYQFDIKPSGLSREALTSTIARSLTKRAGKRGERLGWEGAVRTLITEGLGKAQLVDVLSLAVWDGAEISYETVESRVQKLNVDQLKELLTELCIREEHSRESGDETDLESFIRTSRWSSLFQEYVWDDESDGEIDEGVEEEEKDEAEDSEVEGEWTEWHSESFFNAGLGLELPQGIDRASGALFAHQERSIEKLDAWWRSTERSGVLCLPTGGGKTRTAVTFALRSVVRSGGSVLWLAHRHELVNQAIAAFLACGAEAGRQFTVGRFESGDRKHLKAVDVTVASIPTLAWGPRFQNFKHLHQRNGDYALVVVDECHHSVARTWRRLLKHLRQQMSGERVLGLSATPTRTAKSEQPEFWRIFGNLIHEERPLPLIRAGILASPRLVPVNTQQTFEATADEQRLFEKFQELPPSLLSRIGKDEVRNEFIVRYLSEDRANWGQTLLFAINLEHAELLRKRLMQENVEAHLLHGGTPPEERRAVLKAFRDKRFPVLINVSLFTEGTDIPAVESVFIARPSRSPILFRQMVGRGLRGPALPGGTTTCNVVGFYDNVTQLLEEHLSSTFGDERSALEALGLEEIQSDRGSATDGPGLEKGDEAEATRWAQTLASIRRALNLANASGEGWRTALGVPLLGWWEATAGGRRFFCPVFEGDVEAMGARLARAVHLLQRGQPLPKDGWAPLRWTSDAHFRRFASVLGHPQEPPRYVDLTRASLEEAQVAMANAEVLATGQQSVAEAGASPSAPAISLLEIARLRARASGNNEVMIQLNGKLQILPRASLEAAARFWASSKHLLGGRKDESALEVFANMAVHSAAVSGVGQDMVRSLIQAAAQLGDIPSPVESPTTAPDPGKLWQELRTIASDAREDALAEVRSAWFPDGAGWAEYLTRFVAMT